MHKNNKQINNIIGSRMSTGEMCRETKFWINPTWKE